MNANDDRACDLPEIAAMLGLTENTARRLLRQGRIPGVRIGGKWRASRAILAIVLHHGEEAAREANRRAAPPLVREYCPDPKAQLDALRFALDRKREAEPTPTK